MVGCGPLLSVVMGRLSPIVFAFLIVLLSGHLLVVFVDMLLLSRSVVCASWFCERSILSRRRGVCRRVGGRRLFGKVSGYSLCRSEMSEE